MLKFRANHRGLRELDLFIGAFANTHIDEMSVEALDEFEQILDVPDNTVLDWVLGRAKPPETQGPVLKALLEFNLPLSPI